jgi:hypothetical protein
MARSPQITFLVRDQAFNMTVNGLLPMTYHYLYFEGNQVASSQYKPLGGKIGDPLISDQNGQLSFTYYYASNLPNVTTEFSEYYKFINALAGTKRIVVANLNQASLPEDYTVQAFSYAAGSIKIEAYQPTEAEFQAGFGDK